VSCAANGTCIYNSACTAKKCQDVSCSPNGTAASCSYSNKTCVAASICEVVPPCVEDGQPFVCAPQSVCPSSTDACVSIVCNASATDPTQLCVNVSTVDCNDNNNCTVDSCLNGNCVHNECPTADLCFPSQCNSSNFTCYVVPVPCNDYDACTNDTCLNGSCVHNPVVCDDGDACTNDSCDSTLGCVFQTRNCFLNETCAFDNPDDSTIHDNFLAGVKRTPCKNDNTTADCDSFLCANQTCIYTEHVCNNYLSTAEIIGTSIGGAVIAGIVIAICVCVGVSGGGAYAVFANSNPDSAGHVMNNPLFRGPSREVNNPLHRHNE